MPPTLTPGEAGKFRKWLKYYFPQLGTDDELNGGDAVETLGSLDEALEELANE